MKKNWSLRCSSWFPMWLVRCIGSSFYRRFSFKSGSMCFNASYMIFITVMKIICCWTLEKGMSSIFFCHNISPPIVVSFPFNLSSYFFLQNLFQRTDEKKIATSGTFSSVGTYKFITSCLLGRFWLQILGRLQFTWTPNAKIIVTLVTYSFSKAQITQYKIKFEYCNKMDTSSLQNSARSSLFKKKLFMKIGTSFMKTLGTCIGIPASEKWKTPILWILNLMPN